MFKTRYKPYKLINFRDSHLIRLLTTSKTLNSKRVHLIIYDEGTSKIHNPCSKIMITYTFLMLDNMKTSTDLFMCYFVWIGTIGEAIFPVLLRFEKGCWVFLTQNVPRVTLMFHNNITQFHCFSETL